MGRTYSKDSYHYKRTHDTIDRTNGRYIHFSNDPISTWYDTFCPMDATPAKVRLGPSPFTRHLFREQGLETKLDGNNNEENKATLSSSNQQ